jgi:Lon protease-like protein
MRCLLVVSVAILLAAAGLIRVDSPAEAAGGGYVSTCGGGETFLYASEMRLLFPGATLPLHIFEERYKRMVHDCLQGDRLLGLFLLQKGWDEEGATPTPYDVGGMGRITRAARYPNGSMDILLSGLARVHVLRYVQRKPYLIAEIEMWPDEPDDSEGVEALTRRMVGLFERYVVAKAGAEHELLKNLKLLASPIDLLHLVVTNMPLDVHQKQEILDLRPIDERITMMITFLNRELSSPMRSSEIE